jgi:hypothetical protein
MQNKHYLREIIIFILCEHISSFSWGADPCGWKLEKKCGKAKSYVKLVWWLMA